VLWPVLARLHDKFIGATDSVVPPTRLEGAPRYMGRRAGEQWERICSRSKQ
jgi:hypothetical protein